MGGIGGWAVDTIVAKQNEIMDAISREKNDRVRAQKI